jgi:hypothetical protein
LLSAVGQSLDDNSNKLHFSKSIFFQWKPDVDVHSWAVTLFAAHQFMVFLLMLPVMIVTVMSPRIKFLHIRQKVDLMVVTKNIIHYFKTSIDFFTLHNLITSWQYVKIHNKKLPTNIKIKSHQTHIQ